MKRAAVLAGLGVLSLTGYLVGANPAPGATVAAQSTNVRATPVGYRVGLPATGAPQAVARSGALAQGLPKRTRPTMHTTNPTTPTMRQAVQLVPGGELVSLTRTSILPIAFSIVRVATSRLNVGSSQVVQSGRLGSYRVDVRVYERNGHVVATRLIDRLLLTRPREEIIDIGTHQPGPPPPPAHVVVIPPKVAALNWSALAMCESGGNPLSVGNGYYGLFQFSLPTWAGVGGIGTPIQYGTGEQTYRAQLLYLRSGSSPWPTCGSRLF